MHTELLNANFTVSRYNAVYNKDFSLSVLGITVNNSMELDHKCAKEHIEDEWLETTCLPRNNFLLQFFGEAYNNDPLPHLQECR